MGKWLPRELLPQGVMPSKHRSMICIVLQNNHTLTYSHIVIFQSTTHSSSQAEVKSTLVHEISHYWEATTQNCIVKARPTILIYLKHPLSKVWQQVLQTLKGSTKGSMVKGSGWTLCTQFIVSWKECCKGCGHPLLNVTNLCFVEHICAMFQ